jgi:AraC-like DNA-binding protein
MDKLAKAVDNLAMPMNRERSLNCRGAAGAATGEAVPEAFYRAFPASERDRKWGFYTTIVGASRIGPHSRYPLVACPEPYHYIPPQTRVLHDYQMCYISRGSGWIETGVSGRHRIVAGSLYLLFPGIWHREMPDSISGWDEQYICFDGEIARRVMARNFFSPKNPVVEVVRQETVFELFTEAITVAKAEQPALQQILAGISLYILGQLYSAQNYQSAGHDRAVALIHKAITAMRQVLTAPLDLHKLARDLGLSYSSFRHNFAHHTGMSPHQYLLSLRLARARSLLTSTSLSTKEIAHQSGFQDERYFCRLFRKKNGTTPAQWRAQNHKRSRKPSAL